MWNYKQDYIVKESCIVYNVVSNDTAGILTKYEHDCADPVYVFTPDWSCRELLKGIPMIGYDMSLHLNEYVREGIPCFMSEVMPPRSREDVLELMLSVGLDMGYDMWAYMIEQGRVCHDSWRVKRIPGAVYEHDAYKIKR